MTDELCCKNSGPIPYQPKILEIAQIGDPVLKTVATDVDLTDIGTFEIQQLVKDMEATMYAAPGIGLAAPQISVSLRIIVFYLPSDRDAPGGNGVPFTVLINPEIEKIGNDVCVDWEGCLSVAGKRGRVTRHQRIRYRGFDQYGSTIVREADGWHARVVQHECDHLDGILYPELMQEEDTLLDVEVWRNFQQQEQQKRS